MNFLAHLYLSKNNTDILIGNFIADQVKGNQFYQYRKGIQQGIVLHRAIDTYTDAHETVRQSKRRLHERYRHYDGVIIDIFYDYFLAKNWSKYSEIPLAIYSTYINQFLTKIALDLPRKSQNFIGYMNKHNILYNYQFKDKIQEVLEAMNKRTKGKSQMNLAIEDLINLETELEEDFTTFFDDLINFSNQKTIEIIATL